MGCLAINSTSEQSEFNFNADYLEFETNATRTFRPKFDAIGVEDTGSVLQCIHRFFNKKINSKI
jgi:hypothetical protein